MQLISGLGPNVFNQDSQIVISGGGTISKSGKTSLNIQVEIQGPAAQGGGTAAPGVGPTAVPGGGTAAPGVGGGKTAGLSSFNVLLRSVAPQTVSRMYSFPYRRSKAMKLCRGLATVTYRSCN